MNSFKFQRDDQSGPMRPLVLVIILLTFGLIAPLSAEVGTLPPEAIHLHTPSYRPNFAPALGVYQYVVSWQGIPAANVEVGVNRDGMTYHIWTNVKTYSGIDLFYRLRYNAKADISAVDFSPFQSTYDHQENSRLKKTEITFEPSGEIKTVRIKNDEEPEYHSFNSENYTLDPFSASFVARGLDWKKGETKRFDAFNGKSRYLIKMKAVDHIQMEVNGKLVPVWVISPKVKNLSNPAASKLREAKIYLTDDEQREILEIESEVFVGSVRTRMKSFKPISNTAQAMASQSIKLGRKITKPEL